ncbi:MULTISPECIES: ABC transporter ATP-binding protein [Halorubrum]|uniref:ABC-type D-xylose/L-arabinose transporter n=2 Tax=Halorubrum ezzemoulense TaxID=337243 RepID=A0A256K927_HALEZ|nr:MULTISPECIES: ABC transporter ATP-binding protein [Halorubrum]MDB2225229.1 ABC transporter ATP-binding protein [Halorubrum ezzemoulense]MDB2241935.1 ABC transporter ATP-binding protein [Halorubrum ezzemoulense]MDB2270880.1 ABC transporter ATP-binding protein [Halorubrum ezzemoulense]OYR75998.1 sugar ABC transporter ATP-binding protein [Halorubrum ezzemoulense]OYR77032.1 sugar ABC transporter ATP-binding protein [Halorubrum ezzemoulense]
MASVKLEGITKRYEDVTAVDDMNLGIEDGEFVTFVGPSGCGKSTTMETIAGLTLPTEGTIEIGGRDVTDLPPKDRGISMVFQNIALFPHMDVYDNISFGLRLRKYDQEEVDRRVEEAADIVQLEGMMDRMPSEMSGGQRQRVAIARAIVRNPDAFLMDEPLANLDAELRVHMRTQLQRLHRELDTTIVYVTHDQAQAMTMSDRIAVINGGVLQQVAPPLECYNEPANRFVAGFIGSPSMNFIEGKAVESGFESTYADVEFDPDAQGVSPGQDVTVGVRPEDVHLERNAEEAGAPTRAFDAVVDVIEPVGKEVNAYLLFDRDVEASAEGRGEGQLLINLEPDTTIAEDDDVQVVLDRENVHLFDRASGDAIGHSL